MRPSVFEYMIELEKREKFLLARMDFCYQNILARLLLQSKMGPQEQLGGGVMSETGGKDH